jgi:N-glycosylase/DNA lyase
LSKAKGEDWFSELCFCLLTANTSAELGIRVQEELGFKGFTCSASENVLAKRLKQVKYRFYNRRAHFIFLACRFKSDLKDIITHLGHDERRDWLVDNIKGIGYKEASHFLRNVGFFDYAILDKHIIRTLYENKLVPHLHKSLSRKNYLEYESVLVKLCKKFSIAQGELDLYLWFLKTGKVLK